MLTFLGGFVCGAGSLLALSIWMAVRDERQRQQGDRLTIVFPPEAAQKMRQIMQKVEVPDRLEVIKRALSVYDTLHEARVHDATILIAYSDEDVRILDLDRC